MFHAQQIEEQMLFQPAPPRAASALGALLPLVLLVAFTVYILKDPIANITQERKDRAQTVRIALEQQMRYNALAQTIEVELAHVQAELDKLRAGLQTFDFQVEEAIGVPIDVAYATPTRRLAHAILLSDEFAETWVQILNARITEEMLERQAHILTEVAIRMNQETLTQLDTLRLEELRQWTSQGLQWLQRSQPAIGRLKSQLSELSL